MTLEDKSEHSIIFSAPMVRAILSGKKTQTRRTRGLNRVNDSPDLWRFMSIKDGLAVFGGPGPCRSCIGIRCPYGVLGDRLWVREKCIQFGHERTWRGQYLWPKFDDPEQGRRWFEANCNYAENLREDDAMWDEPHGTLSSLFMPRWASRITLEITDLRIQRVHQISDADVVAEGIDQIHIDKNRPFFDARDVHALAFGEAWNKINGNRPGFRWQDNPWVWAITFKAVTR